MLQEQVNLDLWVTGKQRGITTRWSGRLRDLSGDAEVVYRCSTRPLNSWDGYGKLGGLQPLGNGCDQLTGVLPLGIAIEFCGGGNFFNAALVHDHDAIAHKLDHTEIMGNEKIG